MILRRLAEAIKQENWFTVVLEILIVVIGLFIGLQLDDWNEERKRRAEESQTLERLYGEAVLSLNDFKQETGRRLDVMVRADHYVAAISAGELTEATDEVVEALTALHFYITISPPRAVYDELNNAGAVAEISQIEVRQALSEYYQSLAFITGQLPNFRASVDDFELGAEDGIYNVYNPNSSVRIRRVIDGPRVFRNPAYVSDKVFELRNYIRFTQYYLNTLREAYDLCVALAEQVGGDCPTIDEEFGRYREFASR